MSSITITMPLPSPALSPNAKSPGKWRSKAKQIRMHRHAATIYAIQAAPNRLRWLKATVQATFYYATNRRRDTDNCLASLKSYFDGVRDAGIIADDSGLTHLPVRIEVDKDNPRVELTITETT